MLQEISDRINEKYKARFVSKTQKLLDDRVNETHTFLDASLIFQRGNAIWRQDSPIIDLNKPRYSTNPLRNPEIPVESAGHAYDLFRDYYLNSWISKKNAYLEGLEDLGELSIPFFY